MIGFHLPPSALSSGHLRLLGFVKYLPAHNWTPIVLSASKAAYHRTDTASINTIPEACNVYRAFALDTRRHLGLFGKYPSFLAQPDRWVSWWPAAVWLGLSLIRRYQIKAVWSTYPIMTAHCIAHTLHRLTGLPWIADFRDPVINSVATQNPMTAATQLRWEHRVLSRATNSVFTTPGAMRAYAERYPSAHDEARLMVIPNGFDEEDFAELPPYNPHAGAHPLHLLHSGILYPSGRNPVPFFKAIANLLDSKLLTVRDIRVTLRASGSEMQYRTELDRLNLNEIVTLAPLLPYRDALIEQALADALLLFQGDQYDNQIPTKLYEYLRIGRPIFALVGERGDTAAVLRDSGGAVIVSPDNVQTIEKQLMEFICAFRQERLPKADTSTVKKYSRRDAATMLARLLDHVSVEKTLANE